MQEIGSDGDLLSRDMSHVLPVTGRTGIYLEEPAFRRTGENSSKILDGQFTTLGQTHKKATAPKATQTATEPNPNSIQ